MDWLAQTDLFVLTSRWEGFGHVIIEAMAAGVPVLATNCPHGPADIIDHGVDGWLVEPENPTAIAQAIDHILLDRNMQKNLSQEGKKKAIKFRSETIATKYIDLITQI